VRKDRLEKSTRKKNTPASKELGGTLYGKGGKNEGGGHNLDKEIR